MGTGIICVLIPFGLPPPANKRIPALSLVLEAAVRANASWEVLRAIVSSLSLYSCSVNTNALQLSVGAHAPRRRHPSQHC